MTTRPFLWTERRVGRNLGVATSHSFASPASAEVLMPVLLRSLLLPAIAVALLPAISSEAVDLRGFTAQSSNAQQEWEAKFRAIPQTARLRGYLRRLSARPHHLGSPYQKENAEYMRQLFAAALNAATQHII